jgi:hypothetical protein
VTGLAEPDIVALFSDAVIASEAKQSRWTVSNRIEIASSRRSSQ